LVKHAPTSYNLLQLALLVAIDRMNNEITQSNFAFKNLSFVKNKVTINMTIIEMNRENNNPKFFSLIQET